METMLNKNLNWRRLLGACLVLVGLLFLAVGLYAQNYGYIVVGLSAWLWLLIGIVFGLRYRIATVLNTKYKFNRGLRQQLLEVGIRQVDLDSFLKEEFQKYQDTDDLKTFLKAELQKYQNTDDLKTFLRDELKSLRDESDSGFLREQIELLNSKMIDVSRQTLNSQILAVRTGRKVEEMSSMHLAELQDLKQEVVQVQKVADSKVFGEIRNRLDTLERQLNGGVEEVLAEALSAKRGADQLLLGLSELEEKQKQATSEVLGEFTRFSGKIDSLTTKSENFVNGMQAELVSKASEQFEAYESSIVRSVSSELARSKIDIVQETEAIMELRRLLAPEALPLPLCGGWAMDSVALLNVVKHVLRQKPELIVECGGGTSTIWLAYALKKNGKGKIVSIDHLEEFSELGKATVEQHGLGDYVDFCYAALEDIEIDERKCLWYSEPSVTAVLDNQECNSGIDLLIVDGPPGKIGHMARYPALPVLQGRLSPNAVVIVDDAVRKDERQMMDCWIEEFGFLGAPEKTGRRTRQLNWCKEEASDTASMA